MPKTLIADRIKQLAQTDGVQENRRKLRAMSYIADREPETKLEWTGRIFRSSSSFSGAKTTIHGWIVQLYDIPHRYRLTIDYVVLLPLSSYDSNGDKPLIEPNSPPNTIQREDSNMARPVAF
jgi:hypothetical protein